MPDPTFSAEGQSFSIYEWRGSGPQELHVHHQDDEAWHVQEGKLTFRFADHNRVFGAGETVFVPAGVAHTFMADDDARYLIILTPRLRELIDSLHDAPAGSHSETYRRFASELLE
jgi:quercetin dioxygenase-like cupin family protein